MSDQCLNPSNVQLDSKERCSFFGEGRGQCLKPAYHVLSVQPQHRHHTCEEDGRLLEVAKTGLAAARQQWREYEQRTSETQMAPMTTADMREIFSPLPPNEAALLREYGVGDSNEALETGSHPDPAKRCQHNPTVPGCTLTTNGLAAVKCAVCLESWDIPELNGSSETQVHPCPFPHLDGMSVDGKQLGPDVFGIGTVSWHSATGDWRCLANVSGMLCSVVVRVTVPNGDSNT